MRRSSNSGGLEPLQPTAPIRRASQSADAPGSLTRRVSLSKAPSMDENPATPPTASIAASSRADNVPVGSRVVVDGKIGGYLRFWGTVQFSHGTWAGVELDDVSGKHDGKVGGRRYFQCDADRGIFVKKSQLTKELAVDGQPLPDFVAASKARTAELEAAIEARDDELHGVFEQLSETTVALEMARMATVEVQATLQGQLAAMDVAAAARIEALERDVAGLHSGAAARDTEVAQLTAQLASADVALTHTAAEHKAAMEAHRVDLSRLAVELDQRLCGQKEAERRALKSALELEHAQSRLDLLQAKLERHERDETTNQSSVAELDQVRREIVDKTRAMANAAEDRASSLAAELLVAKKEASILVAQAEDLAQAGERQGKQHAAALRAEKDSSAAVIAGMRADAAKREAELSSFREHLRVLGFADMAAVHNELAQQRTQLTHFKDKVALLEAERTKGTEQLLRVQLSSLEQQVGLVTKKLAAEESRRREAEAAVTRVRTELSVKQNALEAMQQSLKGVGASDPDTRLRAQLTLELQLAGKRVQQLLDDEQDNLKEIDELEEELSEVQALLEKQKSANANLLQQLQLLLHAS